MKKILLLFLFQMLSLHLLATDFTVTSNADTGPGTLREALTLAAANGSATQDRIIFNIADQSEAGRMITIGSNLPFVSSNIIIDGTSQPGAAFGRSNAKIIIQPDSRTKKLYGLMLIDANGVELYGLYIRDFGAQVDTYRYTGAVYMENCENIQVGAPGKNNVFSHNFASLLSDGTSLKNAANISISVNNLKVYANFFGFEPDGTSYRVYDDYQTFDNIFLNFWQGDIQIGSDDVANRNFFGYGAFVSNNARQQSNTAVISIKNNYFRYNIDGQPKPRTGINKGAASAIMIAQDYGQDDNYFFPYSVNIADNKILYPGNLYVGLVTGDVNFKGNTLANDAADPEGYSVYVSLKSKAKIQVGGEAPGEANSIYYQILELYSRQSVVLQRNSIYCIGDTYGAWHFASSVLYTAPLPEVSITKITATAISGKATPLSKVEVFDDGACMTCLPKTYMGTTTADASGNWQYNGTVNNGAIASSTINGYTSYFTRKAQLSTAQSVYKTIHYSCSTKGSIKNVAGLNTGGYLWKDGAGTVVGTDADISDLVPGRYTLSLPNGTCSAGYSFTIYDATPRINETNKRIVQPSCSAKGSITGLSLANDPGILSDAFYQGQLNIYTYKWLDAGGTVKSTSIDLTNADAGTYHLEVTYNNTCTTTYGPVVLTNTTGPNINQATAAITPSNCGQTNGAISNITVTGTAPFQYVWKNALNQQVATTKDLTAQPAGKYTLQVTDATNCGPVFTSAIEIPEVNGVTMDETNAVVTTATCYDNNGSITGIVTTNATLYKWYTDVGALVGIQRDLTNVGGGNYYLIASTASCNKRSQVYTVPQKANNKTYRISRSTSYYAACGANNGGIEIVLDNAYDIPLAYRWTNTRNITVGTTLSLTNLPIDTYTLYGTDESGCEKVIVTTDLGRLSPFTVTSAVVTGAQCGSPNGSVKGLRGIGGLPPYTTTWLNAAGAVVSTSADLDNVAPGTYTATITDQTTCGAFTRQYIVGVVNTVLPTPVMPDLQLCTAGDALLAVKNPDAKYSYRLYDSPGSVTPIADEKSGMFKITVNAERSYYVSQYAGGCESSRATVMVSLSGLAGTSLPNTFSPNGDGINDTWNIPAITNYSNVSVQIFTRAGQKIYNSVGYTTPFDGTFNGKQLPVGTYYYIINMSSACGIFSGSVTIIR